MNDEYDDFNINNYPAVIIMAEYGKAFLWGKNELKGQYIGECIGSYWYFNDVYIPKPISEKLWQAFCEWHHQFDYVYFDYDKNNQAYLNSIRTIPTTFNWFEFNKQGIKLACQLKNELNKSCRVIYSIPSEDFTTTAFERLEIMNDGKIMPLILNTDNQEWEHDFKNQFLLNRYY